MSLPLLVEKHVDNLIKNQLKKKNEKYSCKIVHELLNKIFEGATLPREIGMNYFFTFILNEKLWALKSIWDIFERDFSKHLC